ncbi:MAG: carboxypeptidase-like regulatory domain-containing protein [Myxococcales bacterium]|nr:carboxypeptidase-like regulatory domain-containing protein [Myxococcales bacterium]
MLGRVLTISTLLCVSLVVAVPASAQSTLVVLGLRSVEGDDDVARSVTDQVRAAAADLPDVEVSSTTVSMSQMGLAHGCEEIDAVCLSKIAEGLEADRIIYGTIRRTSARAAYDYGISLSLYDAGDGVISRTVDDTIARSEAAGAALAERLKKLIRRLGSSSTGGSIEVQVNVADAEVRVNDEVVGTARDGVLRLEGLQQGQYRVSVSHAGYASHVSTVTVLEGSEAQVSAVLVESAAEEFSPDAAPVLDEGGGHRLQWLGWTLIGVGGLSLAAALVSAVVVRNIDDDPLLNAYRQEVDLGNRRALMTGAAVYDDVCDAAHDGLPYSLEHKDVAEVADMCSTSATLEVLQWVFLGTGLAAGGAGVALVLTGASDSDSAAAAASAPRFALLPTVGPGQARLTATLQF